MLKVLIAGSDSRLSFFIKPLLNNSNFDCICLSRNEFDLSNSNQVTKQIELLKPNLLINCASINNVDLIEENDREALSINANSLMPISNICSKNKICLMHISTNYIFDGINEFYYEHSTPNPLSKYGKSKLLGETFIKENLKSHYIIRTSNLCSLKNKNILTNTLNQIKLKDYVNFVNDYYISLTWYEDLALLIYKIAERYNTNDQIEYGTYHYSSFFPLTYYDFAKYLSNRFYPNKNTIINPVKHFDYKNFNFSIRPVKSHLVSDRICSIISCDSLKTREIEVI